MTSMTDRGRPGNLIVGEENMPAPRSALDAAVIALGTRKRSWAMRPVHDRVALLDELLRDFAAISRRWVAACLEAKGYPAGGHAAGDEWTNPYAVLRNLRLLRQALCDIEARGRPRIPGPVTARPDGQVVAQVFPTSVYDRLLFGGMTAEVWMEPGMTRDTLADTQALAYSKKDHDGRVALVLGAGNYSSIGPMDMLYKLFVEDRVVLYKAHPAASYLSPLLEEGFRALVDGGFLRVVEGGAADGAYLCDHPGVDEIHVTGAARTFEAIFFGTGPGAAERKAARRPRLARRVTGELGNVGPVIIVPGPWSRRDLAYQAEHLATLLTNNAGCNCATPRLIVQHRRWPQGESFLDELRRVLSRVPCRRPFYPGAEERHAAFNAAHPQAEHWGRAAEGMLPWTLIPGLDAQDGEEMCFTSEPFCSVVGATALDAPSVAAYVDRAVEFANERLWGTLCATILVHPASLRDSQVAAAVERAVAALCYGTVAVNAFAGLGFTLGTTPWGAFPGHDIGDIQSGTGSVHNTLMFSHPQKTVIRAPFRLRPTPAWFVTHEGYGELSPRVARFEIAPSPWAVPQLIYGALRA